MYKLFSLEFLRKLSVAIDEIDVEVTFVNFDFLPPPFFFCNVWVLVFVGLI